MGWSGWIGGVIDGGGGVTRLTYTSIGGHEQEIAAE